MKQTFQKCVTFFGTFLFSWLALSFYFFPLNLSAVEASTECFFWASVGNMAAIKVLISLLFSIFALFVYEQRAEKKQKEMEKKD
ncbi:MAG: hypothetical protein MR290_05125 [Ruminococcus sp.]|nr:hypothetical protein [Ruminococcus sp.]